jgi:hypothetical protein
VEAAVIALAIACTLQTLLIGVLVSTVPLLWYRHLKTEKDLEQLDEIVSRMLEAAGVKTK